MRLSPSALLTLREISLVLRTLGASKSRRARMNRVIFRLSVCAGLRASELANLKIGDVRRNSILLDNGSTADRSFLSVRTLKKRRGSPPVYRHVPIYFDSGTCEDLFSWVKERTDSGAGPDDYLLTTVHNKRLHRNAVRCHFLTASG